jgi:hypothetical protein
MPRIALATCEHLPDWETDDASLHRALIDRGVELHRPAWTDPSFDWASCDAVVIRTTWDYTSRVQAFIGWAERIGGVTRLFNPAPVVRWNTHKTYLRDLAAHGVPTVPTLWVDPGESIDLADAMRERNWRRGFIKPAIGATARETMRFVTEGGATARDYPTPGADGLPVKDRSRATIPPVYDLPSAERHLARLQRRGETALVQPYLASVEFAGEFSAIFVDGEMTHTIRKTPAPGDYRVQDDFNGRDEPFAMPPEHTAFARQAVDAACAVLGEAGRDLLYARVDFLLDDTARPNLTELEAVEPSLFLRHCPAAAERLADAITRRAAAMRTR